jgi:hypothetical protein
MRAFIHCIYSFLCAVAEGRPGTPSLADGLHRQRLPFCDGSQIHGHSTPTGQSIGGNPFGRQAMNPGPAPPPDKACRCEAGRLKQLKR